MGPRWPHRRFASRSWVWAWHTSSCVTLLRSWNRALRPEPGQQLRAAARWQTAMSHVPRIRNGNPSGLSTDSASGSCVRCREGHVCLECRRCFLAHQCCNPVGTSGNDNLHVSLLCHWQTGTSDVQGDRLRETRKVSRKRSAATGCTMKGSMIRNEAE